MRTPSSCTNGTNVPIALEPPPTQARTRSGSLPASSSTWARASSPITRCRSRTSAGEGAGPAAGADDVVGRLDVGHPVPDRGTDRLLERARARLDRGDLSPQKAHP